MNQAQATNTRWIKILALTVIILLVLAYFFRLFTPQQVPQQAILNKNFEGTTTTFEKITFTGVIANIPAQLPIGTAENLDTDSQKALDALIASFKLNPLDQVADVWTSDEYSLSKIASPPLLSLNATGLPSQKKITDVSKAAAVAQDQIKKLFPDDNLQLLEQQISYHDADVHGDTTTPENAQQIEFPFGYLFGPYLVFLGQSTQLPARVLVNADYSVQRMVLQPYKVSIKEGPTIKTIRIPDAIDNINHNKASLVNVFYDGPGLSSLDKIVSGNLTGVTIEYHIDPSSSSIIPYYHFSGQLTNDQNQTLQAEVITPAIQTKFQ